MMRRRKLVARKGYRFLRRAKGERFLRRAEPSSEWLLEKGREIPTPCREKVTGQARQHPKGYPRRPKGPPAILSLAAKASCITPSASEIKACSSEWFKDRKGFSRLVRHPHPVPLRHPWGTRYPLRCGESRHGRGNGMERLSGTHGVPAIRFAAASQGMGEGMEWRDSPASMGYPRRPKGPPAILSLAAKASCISPAASQGMGETEKEKGVSRLRLLRGSRSSQ
jgi:hypothetical protein